jgi:hypothetical protein
MANVRTERSRTLMSTPPCCGSERQKARHGHDADIGGGREIHPLADDRATCATPFSVVRIGQRSEEA